MRAGLLGWAGGGRLVLGHRGVDLHNPETESLWIRPNKSFRFWVVGLGFWVSGLRENPRPTLPKARKPDAAKTGFRV